MRIRRACLNDAPAMEALMLGELHHVSLACEIDGAQGVAATMHQAELEARLRSPDFCYWLAEDARPELNKPPTSSPIGVLGLRAPQHIYHLFVRSDRHRQGVGRALWKHLQSDWPAHWNPVKHITVNASPYGLKAYEAYGFVPTGPLTRAVGIEFIPMQCPWVPNA